MNYIIIYPNTAIRDFIERTPSIVMQFFCHPFTTEILLITQVQDKRRPLDEGNNKK